MMRRLIATALALVVLGSAPSRADDLEAILVAELDSPNQRDRFLALAALLDAGRIEPIRAARAKLLADGSARVRAEALVALDGPRPDPELQALALDWIARAAVDGVDLDLARDGAFVLAALARSIGLGEEEGVEALGSEFPRSPGDLGMWLTSGPHFPMRYFTAVPEPLARRIRPLARRWVEGTRGPGARDEFAITLVRCRDGEFKATLLSLLGDPAGPTRHRAALLLLEHGDLTNSERAAASETAWAEALRTDLWEDQEDDLRRWRLTELAEAGVPEALSELRRLADGGDDYAYHRWLELAAPREVLERLWAKYHDDPGSRDILAEGLLRVEGAGAAPRIEPTLEEHFAWWIASDLSELELEAGTQERLGRWVAREIEAERWMHELRGFHPARARLVGHRLGLPGMIEGILAGPPEPEALDALYDAGAQAQAEAFAARILEERRGDGSNAGISIRLAVAALLVTRDPEAARRVLPAYLADDPARPTAEMGLAPTPSATESAALLRGAAALVLARGGDARARIALERWRDALRGWSRYRIAAWSFSLGTPGSALAWIEEALERVATGPASPLLSPEAARAEAASEHCFLAALLASRGGAARAREVLRASLPEAESEALAIGIRTLGAIGEGGDRDLLEGLRIGGDDVLETELELALARLGDESGEGRLRGRLAAIGRARPAAAAALLRLGDEARGVPPLHEPRPAKGPTPGPDPEADVKRAESGSWGGFAVGSFVVIEGSDGNRIRHSLEDFGENGTIIAQREWDAETETFRPASSHRFPIPGAPLEEQPFQEVDRREETLEIDGREVRCQVVRYVHAPEEGPRETLTLWSCPEVEVPYRELNRDGRDLVLAPAVVRYEVEIVGSGIEARLTGRIVDLDREVEIGSRTVHCAVEEIRATATIGGEVHEVEVNVHRSNDVPGRVAREKRRIRSDGREQTHVETVVEFESR